jgi:hypothetical protein
MNVCPDSDVLRRAFNRASDRVDAAFAGLIARLQQLADQERAQSTASHG